MSKVRANNFTNKAGTGAPTFPYGANVTGVVTTTTVSATAVSATTLSLSGNATVGGNLTVSGTQTIINTTSLEVEDKNIGIASVTPALSDANLDGAGLTIHGLNGDKTLTWDNSNSRMAFSTDLYATRFYGDGSSLTGISVGLTTEASSGGAVTLNLTAAQDHKVTATGITTITVTGGTEADSHTVRIVNSGIATVGFSTYFLFPSGAAPSLPTADGAISLISFTVHRVGAAGTQLLAGASVNFS
jgi:hypothetical protein